MEDIMRKKREFSVDLRIVKIHERKIPRLPIMYKYERKFQKNCRIILTSKIKGAII